MRRCTRWSIAVIVVGLLGLYPLLAPPAHRIDKEHFELIQEGMTLAKVESIFGQPAGNYDWAITEEWVVWSVAFSPDGRRIATAPARWKQGRYVTTLFLDTSGRSTTKTWTGRHGTCTISFDDELRVTGKMGWGESRVEPPWQKWWKQWFGGE